MQLKTARTIAFTNFIKMKPCILVMGICGTGKTTIGRMLSDRLDIPFIEGDDFHPESNVKKMKNGQPLNDEDRQPWLEALALELKKNEQIGCVVSCSALKEKYRSILNSFLAKKIVIIHLVGNPELIKERMLARQNHFMPSGLIASQLADLEIPEEALTFDISNEPISIVKEIMNGEFKTMD